MGRSQSCSSYSKHEDGLNRGAWTAGDDKILSEYIKTHGVGRWRSLPKKAGLRRCGKSCRLRWLNYLRPDIKRGNISPEEEELIIRLYRLLGNRWALISGRLPGRTDNEIKNYWNTHLSKKVRMGESDPRFQNLCKRRDVPPYPNYDEDIYASQNAPVKTTGVRYGRAVAELENFDSYNHDHVPDTHDGSTQEGLKAADDHVVEIDTSKSWSQLLLEHCMGDYQYDRLQPNGISHQFPTASLSQSALLQEYDSPSCDFSDQEFPHSKDFISSYFDSCLDLAEPPFLLP